MFLIIICIYHNKHTTVCSYNKKLFDDMINNLKPKMGVTDQRYMELMRKRFVHDENYCKATHDHLKYSMNKFNDKISHVENKKGNCWLNRGDLECIDKNGQIIHI
jgi:hypothetical protein